MRLVTDYPQWYDGIFDGDGPVFHRMAFTRGGLAKRDQLALFERLGLRTPPHGTVRELAERTELPLGAPRAAWLEEVEAVVYDDELLHGGRGKRRVRLAEALRDDPDLYATLYLPPVDRAINLRHARIGRIGVWLRQAAAGGDWRSNVDDREQLLSCTRHAGAPEVPRVMWAIDFLPTASGLLAIDFNTAPELVTLAGGEISAEAIRLELEHAASTARGHLAQL